MLHQLLTWIIALALTLSTTLLPIAPASANPVQTENVEVQLISEVINIQPGTPFWVGLHFNINPGWHTYWRNPGDSGLGATLNWNLPPGFEVGDIVWPYPQRLPLEPLMNFGYEEEVTLLSQITPPANLATPDSLQLRVKADWLVCEVNCIPEEGTFNLTLPITSRPPLVNQQWVNLFEQARQALPKPSPWKVTVTIEPKDLTLQVEAPEMEEAQIQEVIFFPHQDGIISNPAPQNPELNQDGITLRLQRGYLRKLDPITGVLVIRESLDNQSVVQAFTIEAAVSNEIGKTAATPTQPRWQVLLLALLGGIILNLMPCVFPVLSLKALNIVQKSQKSPQQVRRHAIAFTAGILVSFTVVASVLLILRSLGQQIGWGFQLQSPVFVTLMAYLMFAVGLSLSGVFIFGASIMGIGQRLTTRSGYIGEFFTGVFATVVATPCTAPFMATALGVALTQSVPIAIAIFEMLGLGLALPYLAISFTPGLQRILPKPGAWMETFQQLLAFPMYAATAWLIWVLAQQTGTNGLAAALAGLILIAFATWLHQKTRLLPPLGKHLGSICALVALGFSLSLAQVSSTTPTPLTHNQNQGIKWQAYTAKRLVKLRQSGSPVFLNFSASWCITCLVNERVALNQPETIAAFESKKIALLKADWTNRDPAITKALESFGRSGVPLYVLYPGDSEFTKPIILPQILSPDQVQRAIKKL
ncbi:MAG: thiol:disulfide interchange protein [Moorea sp. SIO3I7]|uniref:protein-disulfide reductase DsbD family protein n=1 Tax=Moorena sp. SIO3I8 TaxID=2607833 RepID=UPI0013C29C47|nr:protein-disulfide reductase DsbD domain-containing protein [Moorena sp. SIO3I8]NEN98883.1 thiol:disulfide interchange protein [Moorena sp. SIO3I7]NEO09073.1 thiol:disulfide interchange protein [Moorena sp. SIO3I8]